MGWSVLAVSDGAGSAKVSSKGSKIACDSVI
ncbi:protein phosphatase 2C domain-containing protein [Flavobacterium sp. AC]|uniref:Protein phosphatase 2C domain-containing protein n=1 Tax=Flavobacterium azizsancarii TaxID=2961580 RepID=A0ABT4WIB7_9FLAO|nr:protein phosphatase 2C domain-containing protein [Flavobacterium azizsancarii]